MSNLVKFSEERIEEYILASTKISELIANFFAEEKVIKKYVCDLEYPVNHHIVVSVAELEQRKVIYIPKNIDDRQMHICMEDILRNAKRGEEFVIFSNGRILSQEMIRKIELREGKVKYIMY